MTAPKLITWRKNWQNWKILSNWKLVFWNLGSSTLRRTTTPWDKRTQHQRINSNLWNANKKILEKNLQPLTETNLERWFNNGCFTSRKILKELSNKKHNNPLDETMRRNYHTTRKKYKKLIKSKKTKLLKSKIDNLVNHPGSQEFWNHLKLIHKNRQKATHNKFSCLGLLKVALKSITCFCIMIGTITSIQSDHSFSLRQDMSSNTKKSSSYP